MEIEEILRLSSAPSSPAEEDCYYNLMDRKYYVYINGTWVETVADTTSTNFYTVKYKISPNDVNYTYQEFVDMNEIREFIKNKYFEEIYIYYGNINAPINMTRIRPIVSNSETEDFATIEICTLNNDVYRWKVLNKISPKIFFNRVIVDNIYINNVSVNNFLFNNNNIFWK